MSASWCVLVKSHVIDPDTSSLLSFVPSGGKTSDALDQALTFPSSRYLDNGTFEVYGWFTPHFFKWHDITTKTYLSHESLENPCIHQQVWFYLENVASFCLHILSDLFVKPTVSWATKKIIGCFPLNLGCLLGILLSWFLKYSLQPGLYNSLYDKAPSEKTLNGSYIPYIPCIPSYT